MELSCLLIPRQHCHPQQGNPGCHGQLDILASSSRSQLLAHDRNPPRRANDLQVDLHLVLIACALPLTEGPAVDGSDDASLTRANAGILLTVQTILRWVSIAVLHYCLAENETRFWDGNGSFMGPGLNCLRGTTKGKSKLGKTSNSTSARLASTSWLLVFAP